MSQDRVSGVQRKIGGGRRASAAGGGSGTTSYQMSATPKICFSEDVRDLAETVDDLCNNEVWFNYAQTSAFFGSIFGNPTSRESKIIHLDLYLEYFEARYPSLVPSEIRRLDKWIRSSMSCILLNRPATLQRAELLWWLFKLCVNVGCFSAAFAVDYLDFNPTLPEFKEYLRPLEGVKSSTAIVRFGDSYSSLHVEMWDRWMYSFLNPTHHTFFSALANVPHPLSSLEGLVPCLIAGYRSRADHPTFEGFAELNFGNVSHFMGISHE